MAINNRDRNNTTRQRTRTVFVPVGGGGSKIETEELSVSENGTYEAGKDKAYSKVTVKVTEPLPTFKIAGTGIKLGYSSFSEVPELVDFEGVTDMNAMFEFCCNLLTIPQLDTSQVTDMSHMFNDCVSLQSIPKIDTSMVINMNSMFYRCKQLQTIPQLDTSMVTNMGYMFTTCKQLQTIPQLDTSMVTDITSMFYECSNLQAIPQLDFSQVEEWNVSSLFYQCTSLTDLGGFVGVRCNLNLSPCPLTHDSIMNVINKAADVTSSPKTLTLGSANLAKLTDEEKAIATSKGWTLE